MATGEVVTNTPSGENIQEHTGEAIGYIYDGYHGVQLEIELENGDDIIVKGIEGGYEFKRPAPKVLDADGVEIKVGDTVYIANAGENNYSDDSICCKYAGEMKVVEFNKYREGYVISETPSGKRIDSPHDYLTHEKPVFDAEGVRICKGDTVWHKGTGDKFTVIGLPSPGCYQSVQVEDFLSGFKTGYDPDRLTHSEPDSLEKLRDDMKAFGEVAADCDSSCCIEYADRLTALIERGA